MRRLTSIIMLPLVFVFVLFGSVHAADSILYNGKVLTADANFSVAEAIAIRDGRVLAVGSNAEILRQATPQTRRVDLKGKTVIPGLIDTHAHLFFYPFFHWREEFERVEPRMRQFRIINVEAESVQDALGKIGDRAKQAQPGHWLHLVIQPESVALNIWRQMKISELDRLAPQNLLLVRLAGGQHYLNSQALDALRKHYGDLPEDLEKDAQGEPTGRVERGIGLRRRIVMDLLSTSKTLAPVFKKEMEQWASHGITTWSSTLADLNPFKASVELDRRGEMPIRFAYSHAMATVASPPQAARFYERLGDIAGHGTPYLWNIGVSTEGLDAQIPNLCATISARPEVKAQEFCRAAPGALNREVVRAMVKAGLRLTGMNFHGDGALDHFMDIVEQASQEAGMTLEEIQTKRHGLDHCTLGPRPDQIERAKRLGIIWSCGPRFFVRGAPRAAEDYGVKYAHEWSVPIGSILSAGGKAVIGADDLRLPRVGAFWHIEKLVTRKDEKGNVWGKEQAVNRKAALLMFTRWAAEYVLREDVLGSLEPGKWADLVVVDRDFLSVPDEEIHKIKVLLTAVGGKLVYTEPAFAQAQQLPQVGYRPK